MHIRLRQLRSSSESPRPLRSATARTKPGSLLAARAANEYVYVAQDMRRILVVAAALFGTLIILWLLIVVMKVIPLPFY